MVEQENANRIIQTAISWPAAAVNRSQKKESPKRGDSLINDR
jgi:hypothetical protein